MIIIPMSAGNALTSPIQSHHNLQYNLEASAGQCAEMGWLLHLKYFVLQILHLVDSSAFSLVGAVFLERLFR